jgi:hypothetical protein
MEHQIELILHPGHSKCGTTSIQSYLYNNINLLEERQIFLPDSRCQFSFESSSEPSEPNYPLWYFESFILGETNLSLFERRMDQVLKRAVDTPCKRIVISSENLSNLHQKHTLDLHRVLAARFPHVQVIYYVRRQDDWILSAWQQWGHKTGKSINAWVDYCLRAYLPPYLRNAVHYQDIYGASSLTVVPMHRAALLNGGLVADFCRRLGIAALHHDTDGEHQNMSVNPYLCEILAAMNLAHDSIDADSVKGLLDRSWLRRPLYRKHSHFMTKACRDRVLDYYEKDNRELHRRFFGSLEYEEIFARVCDAPDAEQIYEQIEGLKDVLSIQMGLLWTLLNKEQTASVGEKRQEILELLTGTTPSWTDAGRILANWPDPDAGLNAFGNHGHDMKSV